MFKFIILTGVGINCENESKLALKSVDIDSEVVHVNDLTSKRVLLDSFDGMIIPGGFSYGDELGSGRVFALKLKKYLMSDINNFIASGKPILGICNGFQVLEKLGIFDLGVDVKKHCIALSENRDRKFIDKWVKIKVDKSVKSVWTNFSQEEIELPIRHGEGRVQFSGDEIGLEKYIRSGRVPFFYLDDVNGSTGKVAGVIDSSGLVLGMMPHPECATYEENSIKRNNSVKNDGRFIFESIRYYLQR